MTAILGKACGFWEARISMTAVRWTVLSSLEDQAEVRRREAPGPIEWIEAGLWIATPGMSYHPCSKEKQGDFDDRQHR